MTHLHADWARQLSASSSLLLFLVWGVVEKMVFGDYREGNHDYFTCEDLSIVYFSFFHQFLSDVQPYYGKLRTKLQNKIPALRKSNLKDGGAPIFIIG